MLPRTAFTEPAGPAFSFSVYLRFLSTASLRVETHWFSLTLGWPLLPDSLTTGSHGSNGAGNPSCWCRSPTWLSKPHTAARRGEFGFFPQNKLTPPPKGGGAGFCSSLGFRVLLGSCLWQPLATTGSHASNRACLGLRWCHFPTWPSKPHTEAHRGEFGTHFLFLMRFGVGRADKSFSSL